MSCIRTWGDEEASIGRRRFRRSSFSSSDICLCAVASSLGCHARVTRFLRYTTAIYASALSVKRRLEGLLERRKLLSCSACSMLRRALVNPGWSSALKWVSQYNLGTRPGGNLHISSLVQLDVSRLHSGQRSTVYGFEGA